jgi:hypothetical protein
MFLLLVLIVRLSPKTQEEAYMDCYRKCERIYQENSVECLKQCVPVWRAYEKEKQYEPFVGIFKKTRQ